MDATTRELRAAHDVLAEFYAKRVGSPLERIADRAVLNLFCDLVLDADLGTSVGDIGCGTGRLAPYLASCGLAPHGVDLSEEMVRVARRDQPGFPFDVADLRSLPFEEASLAGAVCWYSLMYLAEADRPSAFAELHRVVKSGGYMVTAYKSGDSSPGRGGKGSGLGVEFDVYWLSPEEVAERAVRAGFEPVFWAGRSAEVEETQPQGYLLARRT